MLFVIMREFMNVYGSFLENCDVLTGIAKGARFWEDVDAESFPTIDINLTAMIKSTRLAIDVFLKQPKPEEGPIGVIVNTASISGFYPSFPAPIYGASKWGKLSI